MFANGEIRSGTQRRQLELAYGISERRSNEDRRDHGMASAHLSNSPWESVKKNWINFFSKSRRI